MARTRKLVILGVLGSTMDGPAGTNRWERWRPTVSLFQHEELLVQRLHLLYQRQFTKTARLVADDVRAVSPETEVTAHEIALGDPWDFEEVYGALHEFARGYPFDVDREDYLIHITTGTHVVQICLFLLTESRHLPGRLIQSSPPAPRKQGEPGSYAIIDLDLSRYDRIASRFRREQREGASLLKSGIDTRNESFNRLIERIEHVALASRDPILLQGPTGAGKTQLAERIYDLKKARRKIQGELVSVNCATLRGEAATSALFGHVKGAFTGAVRDRPGLLREAHGGLLFLDEIGELAVDEQAMLLRALERHRFLPVGADREVGSDFQLIAGTNRDLTEDVRAGRFRADLLARIDLWTFRLPGLSERPEDIAPNVDYELERHAERAGDRVTFNREGRERFLSFAVSPEARWTRSFRDLGGAITRMATVAPGGRITVPIVDEEIERLRASWRSAPARLQGRLADVMGEERVARLDLFDRMQLERVLDLCATAPSLSEAGRRLFAASRARKKNPNDADRLRKYLGRFGVSWDQLRSAHDGR